MTAVPEGSTWTSLVSAPQAETRVYTGQSKGLGKDFYHIPVHTPVPSSPILKATRTRTQEIGAPFIDSCCGFPGGSSLFSLPLSRHNWTWSGRIISGAMIPLKHACRWLYSNCDEGGNCSVLRARISASSALLVAFLDQNHHENLTTLTTS